MNFKLRNVLLIFTYVLLCLPILRMMFDLLSNMHAAVSYIILASLIFIMLVIINKSLSQKTISKSYLEKSYEKQTRLKLIDITLIENDFYDKFESVFKPVELYNYEKEIIVVISEKFKNKLGEKNTNILIDRELLKHQHNYKNRLLFSLIIPILITINVALLILSNINYYRNNYGSFITDFAFPSILLVIFLTILILWNKYQEHLDSTIDKMLIGYYNVDDTCKFIELFHEIEGGFESQKYNQFNKFNVSRRINKLKQSNEEE